MEHHRQIASGAGLPVGAAEPGQFVAFSSAGSTYAVPIMTVQEIRSWQATTLIPRRTAASRGVLDIRGTIIEVVELGVLLGADPVEPRPGSVVIVIDVGQATLGVLVDGVFDIIQARSADLMTPPQASGTQLISAIVNHDERLVSIIDPSRLSLH
ncbi:MAG: chemotaxis protein CheW [Devosia sp.]